MPEKTTAHRRFFAEMKRRRVFRVAAVYGAASFAVLQAVDIMAEGLSLPPAILRIVTILVLAGFPVALVAAWLYERRPGGGLALTEAAAEGEIEQIVAEPGFRRWLPGILALAGVVLFGLGAWFVGGRILAGDSGSSPDSSVSATDDSAADAGDPAAAMSPAGTVVAVVPFGVQGSDEITYLGNGLVNLLSTKLDGAGDLRTVDPHAVIQTVERDGLEPGSSETGRRIANGFGAGHFIVGDVFEAGGRIQITASLYKSDDRNAVVTASVEGVEEEMFRMVDDLTAQLVSGFASGPGARVRRTAAITTESLRALKAFIEGEQQFRRAQLDSAEMSFQRAIAEDSTFGLAYYRLSVVSDWLLKNIQSIESAEKAAQHVDRLPERDRRMLEVFLTRMRGDNLGAARGYQSLLSVYPDEMEAWLDLSEVQFHTYPLYGRSATEARPAIEHILELDPEHASALIHKARLDLYEGRWEQAGEAAERLLVQGPGPSRVAEIEVLVAAAARDPDVIGQITARMDRGPEGAVGIAAYSAGFSREWELSEAVARSMVGPHRSEESRRVGGGYLSNLAANRGQWEQAGRYVAEIARHSPLWALEQEAILALTPLAPVTEAQLAALVERVRALDPAAVETSDNPNVLFTAHDEIQPALRAYLLGRLAARLGDADEALAMADSLDAMPMPVTAGSLAPDLALGIRAAVHAGAGRNEEALAELESMENAVWYPVTAGSTIWTRSHERYLRSAVLMKLNRLDEAERWLESLGRVGPGEVQFYGPARLLLAEIAELRGDTAGAAELRTELEALWADADPGVRELSTP
jgi:tetratricopeptide (TPR) repeat protein